MITLSHDFYKKAERIIVVTRLKSIQRSLRLDYVDGMEKLQKYITELLEQNEQS
jgi:hypothetical protein